MGPQQYFPSKSCHKWDHNDIFWKILVINATTTTIFVPKQGQNLEMKAPPHLSMGKFLIFQKLYLKLAFKGYY